MIKFKKILKSIIILLVFATIIFNLSIISCNFEDSLNINDFDNDIEDFRSSQNSKLALNYSAITLSQFTAYKLFESIEVSVNVSGFNDVDYTIMQIDFFNNSKGNFNMTYEGDDIYKYIYSPKWYAPTGFQNVSFLIYNESDQVVNAHSTYTNFTIYSNYIAYLNGSEFKRGNTVYAPDIKVDDYDIYNFNWNITVVDNTSEISQINLFNLGNNLEQFSFKIDDRFTQTEKTYYIKINMSDDSPAKKVAAYIPFKVLNTIPEIIVPSINFSSYEFKRTEDCSLSLNVSDIDPDTIPENLTVSLTLITPTGQRESPIALKNNKDWTFSTTFSVDANKPIGLYQAIIMVKDQYDGIGTVNTTLIIKNNPPEINNFWINDRSIEEQIAINYGEDIIFTFNISDVENSIAYVTVSLLDEDNQWFNVSKAYSENMELKIRSEDLITGVWYVYISVTDEDGDTTHITSDFGLGPKEIRIIPDVLTPIMPWITLIIGLIIGVSLGIVFSFRKAKAKYIEAPIIPKKKKKEITKKEKAKIVKEEVEEKPVDETKPEEKIEKKPPQRKIKRKLK